MKHNKVRSSILSFLGGAAWYSAMIILGVAAVGIEADRQARRDLSIATLVPPYFRGYALEALAKDAYDKGEVSSGLTFSRRLVERRPVPAESLSLYAYGLLSTKQTDAAGVALTLAAQRGWRDRFVQQVVVLSALQKGEPVVAAQRTLGLWRQGERTEWLLEVTEAVLKKPNGLEAFKNALSPNDKGWAQDFLTWGAHRLPADSVRELGGNFASHQVQFNCEDLSSEADRLIRHGRESQATALWEPLCGSLSTSNPDEFAFEPFGIRPGPYSWRYPESAGVSVDLSEIEGHIVLDYENSDAIRHVIARRYLRLDPGEYAIESQISATGVEWEASCLERKGLGSIVKLSSQQEKRTTFEVPLSNCATQELRLVAQMGAGRIDALTISRLR